ncbi:hypothetical protein [Nocardioides sp.]|uniref:hypothetical protein n=1 Tax=Nocardioides sp. TaxID=35761 RepID=UPI0025CD6668|nr:hypothetical protein [Nocardioides sp.]
MTIRAIASVGSGVDVVLGAVALQAFLDSIGEPEQGELTQGGEVALAEVLREGSVDLVGGVDVAVRHASSR